MDAIEEMILSEEPVAPLTSAPEAPEMQEDSELCRLQAAYDALKSEHDALKAECESRAKEKRERDEFCALYPDVDLASLPQSVLCDESLPLAAAYALYERRQARAKEAALAHNEKNLQKSVGAVRHDGGNDGSFALSEIKRMSAKEIRAHYNSVLRSLQKQK